MPNYFLGFVINLVALIVFALMWRYGRAKWDMEEANKDAQFNTFLASAIGMWGTLASLFTLVLFVGGAAWQSFAG